MLYLFNLTTGCNTQLLASILTKAGAVRIDPRMSPDGGGY